MPQTALSNPMEFSCEKVRGNLRDAFNGRIGNDPSRPVNGFLSFLFSDRNRSMMQIDRTAQSSNGTIRTVILRFKEETCYSLGKSAITCGATLTDNPSQPLEKVVTIGTDMYYLTDPKTGEGTPIAKTWNLEQFSRDCKNREDYYVEETAHAMMKLQDLINKDLLRKLKDEHTGCHFGDVGTPDEYTASIPMYLGNTITPELSVPNPHFIDTIQGEYREAMKRQTWAILGGEKVRRYMMNQTDTAQANNFYVPQPNRIPSPNYDWYYDSSFDEVYGIDDFVVLTYGVIVPLQFMAHNPDFEITMPNNFVSNIQKFGEYTPDGVWVDMIYKVDAGSPKPNESAMGCGSVTTEMFSHFELLNAGGGGNCDLKDCVNGIFHYTSCGTLRPTCPVLDVCDDLTIATKVSDKYCFSGGIGEGLANVLTVNTINYAADPTKTTGDSLAEILAALQVDHATATIDHNNSVVKVCSVLGPVTLTNSTGMYSLSPVSVCKFLEITVAGNPDLVTVRDQNGTIVYSGDLSYMALTNGVAVNNNQIEIDSCAANFTGNEIFTITAERAECADVSQTATFGGPAVRISSGLSASPTVTLKNGTYTAQQLIDLVAGGSVYNDLTGTAIDAQNAFVSTYHIQVPSKGAGTQTDNGKEVAQIESYAIVSDNGGKFGINASGYKHLEKRGPRQPLTIEVEELVTITLTIEPIF